MLIEHLSRQFSKRRSTTGLEYELGAPASAQQLEDFERRCGVILPPSVRRFYRQHDGLRVTSPSLRILSLNDLALADGRVTFAIFNNSNRMAFETSRTNIAGEWDIVCAETGFLVTLTMASFWSNKIFAWIDRRREVWREEFPSE